MDIFIEIWQTARRNKLRISLTGFAVAWGIFMLIVLLGAGNGLINASERNNDDWVDNSMTVYGGMTSKPYEGLDEGRDIRLNSTDLAITQTAFTNHIDGTGAVIQESGVNISYGDNYIVSNLRGVFPVYADINKTKLVAGRFINDIDMRDRRKVIIIAENQARELLPNNASRLLGSVLRVGDMAFTVIGIEQEDKTSMSNNVTVPFSTLQTIYNKGDRVGNIQFTFHNLNTLPDNDAFEKRYRTTLNRNHQAAPDDEEAVWIHNQFRQAMQMQSGTAIIRSALWVIGLFTLLSGIVGVSNIMLITVRERTREFGIRKAIGASPASILRIIITESIVVTAVFGYIGMLLGILANLYMDATLGARPIETGLFTATVFLDPTVSLSTCCTVTLVLILAGTLAGLMPALKAARVRPIEALNA